MEAKCVTRQSSRGWSRRLTSVRYVTRGSCLQARGKRGASGQGPCVETREMRESAKSPIRGGTRRSLSAPEAEIQSAGGALTPKTCVSRCKRVPWAEARTWSGLEMERAGVQRAAVSQQRASGALEEGFCRPSTWRWGCVRARERVSVVGT